MGRTIKDGVLQHVSPGSIHKFTECERAWGFRYISRIVPDATKAQQAGRDAHSAIEHFALTGEMALSRHLLAAKVWLPTPPIDKSLIEVGPRPKDRFVLIADVPVWAVLDWLNDTGSYIDPQGEPHKSARLEVVDWKTSNARDPRQWAKAPGELRDDLAMSLYALWAQRKFGEHAADQIRVSHVTMSLKQIDAFKRTALTDTDQCQRVIDRSIPVVERMKIAAAATNPNDLEPNYDHCHRYYTGCPYLDVCNRSTRDALFSYFGPKANQLTGENMSKPSLLDVLQAQEAAADPIPSPHAPPPEPATPLVLELLERIAAHGRGTPALKGDAAKAYAKAKGIVYEGATYAGTGRFGSEYADSVEMLAELADGMDERLGKAGEIPAPEAPAQPTSPLVAPDAPTQDATMRAAPVSAEVEMSLAPEVQAVTAQHRAAHEVATAAPPADAGPDLSHRVLTEKGSVSWKASCLAAEKLIGELRAGQVVEGTSALVQEQHAHMATSDANASLKARIVELEAALAEAKRVPERTTVAYRPDPARVEIFVDCLDAKVPGVPLHDYIDKASTEIAKVGNAPHLLLGDNQSPLAFGKWQGAVALYVADNAPAPGRYFLHNVRGNSVLEAFVDALRPLSNVVIIRGL